MSDTAPSAAAILRRPEVERITGLSYSTLYRQMRAGQFPVKIRLGEKAVGWRKNEVLDWINRRERVTPAPITTAESGTFKAPG